MSAVRVLFFVVVASTFAFAQQSPCNSKCNQQASECMKTCTGDPKDAQKPEQAKQLMQCLKTCELQNTQCKGSCK